MTGKKVYISGRITGLDGYEQIFAEAEKDLQARGAITWNPAVLSLNPGFNWEDYMRVCLPAIDFCDAIYMLENWQESRGARQEHEYALLAGKRVYYEVATR